MLLYWGLRLLARSNPFSFFSRDTSVPGLNVKDFGPIAFSDSYIDCHTYLKNDSHDRVRSNV